MPDKLRYLTVRRKTMRVFIIALFFHVFKTAKNNVAGKECDVCKIMLMNHVQYMCFMIDDCYFMRYVRSDSFLPQGRSMGVK